MTSFEKKVLTAMSDKLNHGGSYFAYACGVDKGKRPQAAGRFITGYLTKLAKKGLVQKIYTPRGSISKYKITQKGIELITQENKTLFDDIEDGK